MSSAVLYSSNTSGIATLKAGITYSFSVFGAGGGGGLKVSTRDGGKGASGTNVRGFFKPTQDTLVNIVVGTGGAKGSSSGTSPVTYLGGAGGGGSSVIGEGLICLAAGGGGGSNGELTDGQNGINIPAIASTGTVLIAPPTVTTSGGGGGGGAVAGTNGISSGSDFTGGTAGQSYANLVDVQYYNYYFSISSQYFGRGGDTDIKGTDGYVLIRYDEALQNLPRPVTVSTGVTSITKKI